jgi:hypothetical protein
MFGWGKRKGEVERFNSLNPLCATIFHEWFRMSGDKSKSSEQVFEDEKVRNQLDKDYANGRAARNEPGVEKAIENIVMQIVGELLRLEAEYGQKEYAELCGMAAAIGLMRQIVFGFAPGLSSNGPSEAHEITVRIVFILTRMFANKTPNTFQFGVGTKCCLFGVRCHELRWSGLAESDQDKAVSMWLDGYEVRQVEQYAPPMKIAPPLALPRTRKNS